MKIFSNNADIPTKGVEIQTWNSSQHSSPIMIAMKIPLTQ